MCEGGSFLYYVFAGNVKKNQFKKAPHGQFGVFPKVFGDYKNNLQVKVGGFDSAQYVCFSDKKPCLEIGCVFLKQLAVYLEQRTLQQIDAQVGPGGNILFLGIKRGIHI